LFPSERFAAGPPLGTGSSLRDHFLIPAVVAAASVIMRPDVCASPRILPGTRDCSPPNFVSLFSWTGSPPTGFRPAAFLSPFLVPAATGLRTLLARFAVPMSARLCLRFSLFIEQPAFFSRGTLRAVLLAL